MHNLSKDSLATIMQGRLPLFSAVNPMARFTVYAAMNRNKRESCRRFIT